MLDAAGHFERDCGDGLYPYERELLDQWDAGASIAAIAERAGCSAAAVRHVVELYDDRAEARVPARLVAANDAHVDALRRVRGGMKRSLLDVGQIEALLEDRIEALVGELLPNARREGHELCVASLAGEPGQSLRVHVGGGAKRGWWKDFGGGALGGRDGGDALHLVACVLFGGDIKRAVAWAKSWLHLDELDPGRIEQHRLEAAARAEQRAAAVVAERVKALASARARWHQGKPLERGDPVDRYLRSRGIDFSVLGRAPGVLRFHPSLQYGFNAPGAPAPVLPGMVAMITNLAGEQIGTHRTFLDPRTCQKAGPDLIGYAPNGKPNKPKKVMGEQQGGHIPLWKGAHRCPLRDIPAGTDVYVAEGCEDGLTAACADPSLRIIAGINVGNYLALELPPQMGRLIFLTQNDPAGSDAAKALARAVTHHRAAGRRVLFVPVPAAVKDLNDLAMAGMREDG